MRKMKNVLRILVIVPVFFLLFSCNPLEDDSKSDSMLIVVSIVGTDVEENEVNFLQSDVVKINVDSGEATVAADSAKVTFSAKMLDPAPALGSSHYSNITVDRYVVSYVRSDGKNLQGVDVPYSFEGSMSAYVELDSQIEAAFVVVRAVAKLEPPLINMREGRGDGELHTTAKIDFYGRDNLGNKVKAIGYLSVFFANYVTEEESSGGGN
jgi:hypothetical protein